MEPMSSASKLYNLVRQEEQGINSLSTPQVESAAFYASRPESRPQRSYISTNNKRPRSFFDHCNRHGHLKSTCWKLNGYPKDLPKPREHDHRALATIAGSSNHAPTATHGSAGYYNGTPVAVVNHAPAAAAAAAGQDPDFAVAAAPPIIADQYVRLLSLLGTDNEDDTFQSANFAGPLIIQGDWME